VVLFNGNLADYSADFHLTINAISFCCTQILFDLVSWLRVMWTVKIMVHYDRGLFPKCLTVTATNEYAYFIPFSIPKIILLVNNSLFIHELLKEGRVKTG
jgi:hypothetical protein